MSTYRSSIQRPLSNAEGQGTNGLKQPSLVSGRSSDLVIRPVQTIDEYHACETLQYRAWTMPDELEIVPLHLLVTVHKNGGLLLGAFEDDQLVGFVFGFPGLDSEGRLKHCSHMMGIAPEVQNSGIGYRLKLAQREFSLAQDLDLVTWTYDPLESRNAYLNLHKLGAVCGRYIRDLYGALRDGLNAGLLTDRFEVAWWISSERVQQRLFGVVSRPPAGSVAQAIDTRRTAAGWVAPGSLTPNADAPVVQVEIPDDYRLIKSADPALALEWRLASRQVFESYFAAGYTAVDFVSHKTQGGRRSFYVLQAA